MKPQLRMTDATLNRIVLLGASNVTLAWPRIIRLLSSMFPEELEIYTAHGMGRSYCQERSGFALRQLPGILRSDLWEALPTTSEYSTASFALITDLGNDLVYGRSPTEVADAAIETVKRIRKWNNNCRIVMTRPPVESVNHLGRLRFSVCKAALFPFSGLKLPATQQATQELDDNIVHLAGTLNIPLAQPQTDWYWLDPIHVRWKHQTAAFEQIMRLWGQQPQSEHLRQTSKLLTRPLANKRWVLGKERLTDQPVLRENGVRVFAY